MIVSWLFAVISPLVSLTTASPPQMEPSLQTTPLLSLQDLIQRSKAFQSIPQCKFRTEDNQIINQLDKSQILQYAKTTRIVLTKQTREVIKSFLDTRSSYPQNTTHFYKGMTVNSFITRLITKRPLSFFGANDYTILRNGQRTTHSTWKSQSLPWNDYLTYEEMAISALLGVSSPTTFINSGSRQNKGEKDTSNKFEKFGILVGLVGPRFQVEGSFLYNKDEMESKHLVQHDVPSHFQSLYPQSKEDWAQINGGNRFNVAGYRDRLKVTFSTLLYEAELRGIEYKKKTYVRVVGYGLGVWAIDKEIQYENFARALIESIEESLTTNIKVVDLSYVFGTSYNDTTITTRAGQNVTFILSKSDTAAKLEKEYEDLLLVTSYAWDSNAFPGNEYWFGSLDDSSDPAALCCSLIGELQNAYINPFADRITVVDGKI